MVDNLFTQCQAVAGDNAGDPDPLEEFEISGRHSREQAVYDAFGVGRCKGAVILDPPPIGDVKQLVREDLPWYISAALLQIFQSGASRAAAEARRRRGATRC